MRAIKAALSITILLGFSAAGITQEHPPLRYAVVYSDESGITHFRDEYLAWKAAPSTGNALLFLTTYLDADKIGFLHIPRGLRSDWHAAPSKRFVIVLSGVGEIEVGDGERRSLPPGSIVLMTDAQGQGHRTNVIGHQDILLACVPVP